jgi:hypothetical protein
MIVASVKHKGGDCQLNFAVTFTSEERIPKLFTGSTTFLHVKKFLDDSVRFNPENQNIKEDSVMFLANANSEAPGEGGLYRWKFWRRGSGSNRRIKVLQTSPLPLGYRALGGLPSAHLILRRSVPQARAIWSGRPGSNRRHLPWQGSTLPLSYSRSSRIKYNGPVVLGQRGGRCMRVW